MDNFMDPYIPNLEALVVTFAPLCCTNKIALKYIKGL